MGSPPLQTTPLQTLLRTSHPSIRHLPTPIRPMLAAHYAHIIHTYTQSPSDDNLWLLWAFPKLILAAPARSGKRHHKQTELEITRKLALWTAGEFQALLSQYHQAHANKHNLRSTTKKDGSSAIDNDSPLMRRIKNLVEDGASNKALKTIMSNGIMDANLPEVHEALVNLHPDGQCPLFSSLPDGNPPDTSDKSAMNHLVKKIITTWDKASAPGPSGLRASHLQEMLHKEGPHAAALLRSLVSFISKAVKGEFPLSHASTFSIATLIPLKKKDNTPRPIAIGEVLRRLISKFALRLPMIQLELQNLIPHQLGVGVPDGCSLIANTVTSIIPTLPPDGDWTILQIDLSNAYNCITRQSTLDSCATTSPSLLPWAKWIYCQPSPIFVGERTLFSQRGVQQGDPLGPVLFSLGISPITKALSQASLPLSLWYLDDGLILAPNSRIKDIIPTLQQSFAQFGLSMNTKKTVIWGPGNSLPFRESLPTNHIWNTIATTPWNPQDGITVLGVPCNLPQHTSHTANFLNKTLDSLRDVLTHIGRISDSQLQHHLLRSCADASKAVYLLRNCPANVTEDFAKQADDLILQTFEDTIHTGTSKHTRLQICLPFRHGGCGIKSCTQYRLPLRLGALLNYYFNRPLLHIALHPDPTDTLQVLTALTATLGNNLEPLSSWLGNPVLMKAADAVYRNPSWWTNHIHQHNLKTLTQLATNRDIPRLLSQKDGNGASWMATRPSRANNTIIPSHYYQLSLKWWLGLPVSPQNTNCPMCQQPMDIYGDHLICCKHNNFTRRHTAIQNVLTDALSVAHIPHTREAPLQAHNAEIVSHLHLRPADILLPNWANGRNLAVDLTISHPAQRTEAPHTFDKASSFLRKKETAKHQKYDEPCKKEGWDFQPLTFDTWGKVGPTSDRLLHRIIQKCTSHHTVLHKGTAIQELYQRISLALMRQIWSQLSPGSTFW